MKHLFFIFFIILVSVSFVSASLNLNKGTLKFEIEKGERVCQKIKISSEDYKGKISIRDIWPEEGEEDSNFNKYTLNSDDYNINVEYPNEILDFSKEEEIEVCLLGEKIGNFKGALIFTPEAGEDTIKVVVEIGTWLMVNVVEKQQEQVVETNNPPNPPSGGGGGNNNINVNVEVADEEDDNSKEEEELDLEVNNDEIEENEAKSKITGAVIGGNGKAGIIIGVLGLIAIAGFAIYNRRKNNQSISDDYVMKKTDE